MYVFNWKYLSPYLHEYLQEVLDYVLFIYNLTDANLLPALTPTWYQLYSFKQAYGVNSLRPNEMAKLAGNIARNRSLTEQYFRYTYSIIA